MTSNTEEQKELKFTGNRTATMDPKGRLFLRSAFRNANTDGHPLSFLIATPMPDSNHLVLVPEESIETLLKNDLKLLSLFNRVSIDNDGRIIIRSEYRQILETGKDKTVIVGCGSYIELWKKDEWEEEEKNRQEQLKDKLNPTPTAE